MQGHARRMGLVESYDKTWSTGEGTDKPVQDSCLENPMNREPHKQYEKAKRYEAER